MFWLIFTITIGGLIYLLSPILTPFLFAALLAYLGDPIADRLEKLQLSRTMAVVVVFLIFFGILLLTLLVFIPLADEQIRRLSIHIPDYLEWLKSKLLPAISNYYNLDSESLQPIALQDFINIHIGDITTIFKKLIVSLKTPANIIITTVTYIFFIPVVTFYLLRDWDILIAKIEDLLPRKKHKAIKELILRSDEVLGGFLRGQLFVMISLGFIYSLGLSLLELDMAIILGVFAGLVSFVPYLGLIIGVASSGIMAIIQFQDVIHPIGVILIFVVAQLIEGVILTPKFVGDQTGLHPVAVLFAVLAGGQLFGFMGVLLALPVAAIINVFLATFKEHYLKSNIYQSITETEQKAQPLTNAAVADAINEEKN